MDLIIRNEKKWVLKERTKNFVLFGSNKRFTVPENIDVLELCEDLRQMGYVVSFVNNDKTVICFMKEVL